MIREYRQLVSWCGPGAPCAPCPNVKCKMIRQFATEAADDAVRDRIMNGGNLTKAEGLTDRERRFACMMLERFDAALMLKCELALAKGVGIDRDRKQKYRKAV